MSTILLLTGCTSQTDAPESSLPPEFPEEIPEQIPELFPEEVPELTPDPLPEEIPEETPEEEPKESTFTYLKCTASKLTVRSGTSSSTAAIGYVERGDHLPMVAKSGNWYETRYLGKKGYVHADYLTPVKITVEKSDYEGALETAYDLLGTKYVYGAVRYHDGKGNLLSGFNPKEFDCSSLVQYAYYIGEGIILDVNTRTQVKQGMRVDQAQRGDLLYMTNDARRNKTGIERIGHVGIYLGGNLMLHTSSDYAKIIEMTSAKWKDVEDVRRM